MSAKQTNQHKPCPPIEVIGPAIKRFYDMAMNDKDILAHLHDRHIDHEQYGLGLKTLKKMRKELGLLSTRQQAHSLASATPALFRVRARYPKAGLRDMMNYTFREEGIKASRKVMEAFFKTHEPEGIKQRKAKRLKRKRFWAAGVNDLWAIDQHDKWKRFGLWLHTGIEPYSGRILWLRVWWTNKNPRLILHYYLDTVAKLGAMPLVTQSDPGSENYGVANGHTTLRHMYDPSLTDTRQHRWMRLHKNVKPEISWSQMRRRFTPGFEDMLDDGINQGWYDPNDPLDVLLFRWLFIPWLQEELTAWMETHNASAKRADKNKILPHGRPQLIFEAPNMFDSLDFKVGVRADDIEAVREHYAPSGDAVFELVPSAFDALAQRVYQECGEPVIGRGSIWEVYAQMLVIIRTVYAEEPSQELHAARHVVTDQENFAEEGMVIPLTEGLRELRNGDALVGADGFYYMGGVDRGYAGPGDKIGELAIGGGARAESSSGTRTADNYPASFDNEDDAMGLETETAMVCVQFSDDEPVVSGDEW